MIIVYIYAVAIYTQKENLNNGEDRPFFAFKILAGTPLGAPWTHALEGQGSKQEYICALHPVIGSGAGVIITIIIYLA